MFKTLCLGMLTLLAIGGSALAGSKNDCKNAEHFQEIDKKELTDLLQKKQVFVVDVNSTDSFDKNHIPTAIHYGDFKTDKAFAKALPSDPNALIVSYCGGQQCGAWQQAATAACNAKHTNVRHFKAGITGWMADNQTFFDSKTQKAPAATTATQ